MPTNIFFENLNKEEIIQILRMFEAREEKLQHQIEKLKKKIHAPKRNRFNTPRKRTTNEILTTCSPHGSTRIKKRK